MCDVDEQVQKLIQVLALTLRCGRFSKDPKNFALNVQRALYIALKNVSSVDNNGWSDSGTNGTFASQESPRSFMPPFTPFLRRPPGNGSSEIFKDSYNFTHPILVGHPASTIPGHNGFRLHRLEIIKVVVLIVVISIILLTTCRMVFQLFLRFRPEKTP